MMIEEWENEHQKRIYLMAKHTTVRNIFYQTLVLKFLSDNGKGNKIESKTKYEYANNKYLVYSYFVLLSIFQ